MLTDRLHSSQSQCLKVFSKKRCWGQTNSKTHCRYTTVMAIFHRTPPLISINTIDKKRCKHTLMEFTNVKSWVTFKIEKYESNLSPFFFLFVLYVVFQSIYHFYSFINIFVRNANICSSRICLVLSMGICWLREKRRKRYYLSVRSTDAFLH